ncbi:hypothetical protein BGZ65_002424 [Modicella reniformis]|uniref:Uncharacterized protein n=1 Tax=Modicella reniformis TaxID=1440133 RepID=A0A9P6ILS1_9FUNG|nr:hypothetical protein BGZ65_002424 [Modicella reniformis]
MPQRRVEEPLVGSKINAVATISPLEHVNGPKYADEEPIVGVNNESMISEEEHDVEKVRTFLSENNWDVFRYTVYVDTPENHARECLTCLHPLQSHVPQED